jgi:hypothetical protein
MDENEQIKAMALRMNNKFEKYWRECNLLMVIVVILDPRFKMVFIWFCFPVIYKEPKTIRNIEFVLTVLHELYDAYVKNHI